MTQQQQQQQQQQQEEEKEMECLTWRVQLGSGFLVPSESMRGEK